jgi:hypothetical protein
VSECECVCVCMQACVRAGLCTCAHTCMCMFVCMCACVRVSVCLFVLCGVQRQIALFRRMPAEGFDTPWVLLAGVVSGESVLRSKG